MPIPVDPQPAGGRPEAHAQALLAAAVPDAGLSGVGAALQRVCRAAVDGLGLLGAVVHVMSESGAAGIGASSDARAERLGELPLSAGEGPSLEAFASRRPVLVPDLLGRSARWPGYVEVAAGQSRRHGRLDDRAEGRGPEHRLRPRAA